MDAATRGPLPIVPMTALMGLGTQAQEGDDENPMSTAPDEEGCAEHADDTDDEPEDSVEAMNRAAQRWTTLISMKA